MVLENLDWGIWERGYGRTLEDWEKAEIEMNSLALIKVLAEAKLEQERKIFERKEAELEEIISMIHIY
jgi:hypothetical protein